MHCSKCGIELHEYYEKNGKNYCPSCIQDFWPKCAICGRPMNRWIESEKGKKYCSPECREKDLPRCCICGKSIDRWMTDKKGNVYCSETCFEESCPRCDACGKRMKSWSYTQTGIKFCDKICGSKIEDIMEWYERENISSKPFKSFSLSKANEYEQTKMLSTFTFLLLATGINERNIAIIVQKICRVNSVRQQDYQYYIRKAYSTSISDLRNGIALLSGENYKYFYAQLLILSVFCIEIEDRFDVISESLSVLNLTKYEIRFLINHIVRHI